MKLIPVLTEKSLSEAQNGKYTFWVGRQMNKGQIRRAISQVFGVEVVSVRTINMVGRRKKNSKGKIIVIKPRKKAMVTLKKDQKIDLFEEKKK